MKCRIGEDEVGRRVAPFRDVAQAKFDLRQALAGCNEHVGRGIEADDRGFGVALGEQGSRVAGSAAEIDDSLSRAFALEAAIGVGAPIG